MVRRIRHPEILSAIAKVGPLTRADMLIACPALTAKTILEELKILLAEDAIRSHPAADATGVAWEDGTYYSSAGTPNLS